MNRLYWWLKFWLYWRWQPPKGERARWIENRYLLKRYGVREGVRMHFEREREFK